jgi:predicted cation transporter
MAFLGLFIILVLVLAVPFFVKKAERNLEIFLFVMGCIAVTITSQWSKTLLQEALAEPLKITIAVFIAGLLFRLLQKPIAHNVNRVAGTLGIKPFVFLVIVMLGFLSSIITAIIAALILVEIVSHLKLDRKNEVFLVILACFSIGFGAALTPIGEPLSTIVIAKLKGAPYHADFFFLLRQLWVFIMPGIIFLGLFGAILMPREYRKVSGLEAGKEEDTRDICLRAIKVYLFVMALVFLGKGFKPLVESYVSTIPYHGLYWLNMLSAILDNATLAAAEIGPTLNLLQIKSALLGMLIAGGMLIPGNIPNIIAAGKLKIKSSEWAKFALPLGLVIMALYFFLINEF